MKTAPPSHIGFAVFLAYLAGSVDAVSFSMLGGIFVSFMSGNSTRLGVSLVQAQWERAADIALVVFCFTFGSGLGYVVAKTAGAWHRIGVLSTEAALLAVAGAIGVGGAELAAGALMAVAMGVENATFLDNGGETRINVTFMTGALVKLGQNLAALALGEERERWWPHFLLWLGLSGGAVSGAFAYRAIGISTVFLVCGALVVSVAGLLMTRVRSVPAT